MEENDIPSCSIATMNQIIHLRLFILGIFTLLGLSTFSPLYAQDTDVQESICLIGNSLTWDTVPSRMEEDVQWHVDCGKSLKFIYEHPQMPCVKTSTLWTEALKAEKYDIISVQPHYGTTLDEDVETISKWIELQPQAVFIIHTGWARSATLTEEYFADGLSEKMSHQPAYLNALITQLKQKHPETEFRTTHAMRLLIELKKGIDAESVPLSAVEDLYRDAIHMSLTSGRYLMHNAMRETIGQKRTSIGFEKVSDDLRVVLDNLLDQRTTWDMAGPAKKAQAQ